MKILKIFIVFMIGFSALLYANQNLIVPKTRLEYVLPDRQNFDEKIQYDFEEIN